MVRNFLRTKAKTHCTMAGSCDGLLQLGYCFFVMTKVKVICTLTDNLGRHLVVIWISISFGLQIGLYCKLKENIGKTDIKDHTQTDIGSVVALLTGRRTYTCSQKLILVRCRASIWIWGATLAGQMKVHLRQTATNTAACIVMIWSAVTWMTWRIHEKRGTWKPAAWMQYIGNFPAAAGR